MKFTITRSWEIPLNQLSGCSFISANKTKSKDVDQELSIMRNGVLLHIYNILSSSVLENWWKALKECFENYHLSLRTQMCLVEVIRGFWKDRKFTSKDFDYFCTYLIKKVIGKLFKCAKQQRLWGHIGSRRVKEQILPRAWHLPALFLECSCPR